MDFVAKDASVYTGENNKAQKSEPKTDLSVIKSHVFNTLLKLPQADAPFPTVEITALNADVFQDISKWTDYVSFLTEEKYNKLNEAYKKTLSEDDYDDDLNCPMCVVGLWTQNPKKPQPFPEGEIVDLVCGHPHHKECLQFNLETELHGTNNNKGRCSRCTRPFFYVPGEQPSSIVMKVAYDPTPCVGFENYGSIVITYDMSNVQEQCPTKEYKNVLPATPAVLQKALKLYTKTFLLHQLFPFYKDDGESLSVAVASGVDFKPSQAAYDETGEQFLADIPRQFEALGVQLSPDELSIE